MVYFYPSSYLLQGDVDVTIILPHCLSRSNALYREPVIKVRYNNSWVTLQTEEVVVEEYKVG